MDKFFPLLFFLAVVLVPAGIYVVAFRQLSRRVGRQRAFLFLAWGLIVCALILANIKTHFRTDWLLALPVLLALYDGVGVVLENRKTGESASLVALTVLALLGASFYFLSAR